MSYSKNYNRNNNWNGARTLGFDLKAEPAEERYNESPRNTSEFVRVKQDLFVGDRSKLGWSSPSDYEQQSRPTSLHRDWTHTPDKHHLDSYENERRREEITYNPRDLTPPYVSQHHSPVGPPQQQVLDQPPTKRRASVFERLSYDHRPIHKTWQNEFIEPPHPAAAGIPSPALISMPNFAFEVVNPPAPYSVPVELPCSSKIIRTFTQSAGYEEYIPSKYDMNIQKEIACIQKRNFRYTTNPSTVITDDGQGLDQVYVMPHSTNMSLHKRFA